MLFMLFYAELLAGFRGIWLILRIKRYKFSRGFAEAVHNARKLIPLLRAVEGCAKISTRENSIFTIFLILPSENIIYRHYVKLKIRAST